MAKHSVTYHRYSAKKSTNKHGDDSLGENVVQRLKRRTEDAKRLGFVVRMEILDGQQATWCEIRGVKTLFLDLSQTANEQLRQLDETLEDYLSSQQEMQLRRQNPASIQNPASKAA